MSKPKPIKSETQLTPTPITLESQLEHLAADVTIAHEHVRIALRDLYGIEIASTEPLPDGNLSVLIDYIKYWANELRHATETLNQHTFNHYTHV